jgi:hypothetical protein
VTIKIPQGGHSVVAAVTAASLMLVGAAAVTMVLETPLTQALAATPVDAAAAASVAARPAVVTTASDTAPDRAKLARCACSRWRRAAATPEGVQCAVDELVISQDWVVARLNLHDAPPRSDFHAVEVMHLIGGHVDEDWHLASTHAASASSASASSASASSASATAQSAPASSGSASSGR